MAIPFNVPEEATPNSNRTSSTATPSTAASAASPSTSTSQPTSPATSSAGGSSGQLPPMMQLNREYVMLAFMEAAQRYYRDTQGGLYGYYASEPTSPAYFHSASDEPQSTLTDRFYGTPMPSSAGPPPRRNRSNSLPAIRAHLSSRSRDVNNNVVNNNNNNVYEEHDDEDDDELENLPRRFAKDLMARQTMQEFSGCIPKRRKKRLFEQQQDKTEFPQQQDNDTVERDNNTRDGSAEPKDVVALSLILLGALALGIGLMAVRKI